MLPAVFVPRETLPVLKMTFVNSPAGVTSMTSDIAAVRVVIVGNVQGVGFRYFIQSISRALQVVGWVRNRDDGAVEAEIFGPAASVNAVLERIRSARGHQIRSLTAVPIPIPTPPVTEFEIRP
jgi:acylphosphatase